METQTNRPASLLDTDLYKFTMSAAYFQLYRSAEGKFEFIDRNHTVYDDNFLKELKKELWDMEKIELQEGEKSYLLSIRYLPTNYIEWLGNFRYERDKINAYLDDDGHLHIEVQDLMYKATLYEVPLLALVSELWHKYYGHTIGNSYYDGLEEKMKFAVENNLRFMEFGTRRRFSYCVQFAVYRKLLNCKACVGTSNVFLSKLANTKPMGTMAHEWIQFHQGIYGFKRANYLAMEAWCDVYGGDLGTALTDTFTTDSFLKTLTMRHAKLFDGMRQDSGDEIEIGEKIIDRYKSYGIDPTTKTIVFSNGLNVQKYFKVAEHFKGRIRTIAGIGTDLTCDVRPEGFEPMNIVMKLTKCRFSPNDYWEDVIKISDDPGKLNGDKELYNIAKHELHLFDYPQEYP